MYENLFERIIEASQKNSLTFFVGAGISAVSGAPKWADLIKAICSALGISLKADPSSDDFLRIPQMYYYSINQDDKTYYSFIEKCFGKSRLMPNIIHKMLLDFNPASFITTNFDELLEEAAVQNGQGFKSIACDTEIPLINGDRYILKLHGDLKHRNIVLKEEDYLNYSERFKLTETVLKSIFSMNTVVFIGYSLNDYNIKLVLNWAKTLLKDQFNAPIFIRTESEPLSHEELLYHESKGVKVVECKLCNPEIDKDTSYIDRYRGVLNAIKAYSSLTVDSKSDTEAFEVLYDLLLPLNQLNALRMQDIREKIGKYVYLGSNGVISLMPNTSNLLKRYSEINALSHDESSALDEQDLERYNVISSVFIKARITHIQVDNMYHEIRGIDMFADPYCIGFDFHAMYNITRQKKTSNHEAYKKAYYLARLSKYEDAYFLFQEVANKAFIEGDYLLYYLSQTNCDSLYKAMSSINRHLLYHECFDLKKIEENALTEEQSEHLFDRLPIEFKNTYRSLKDLNSPNILYEYSYRAFIDGKELEKTVEIDTLEMGQSSSDKAVARINDYLHFLLANGLFLDMFEEFKATVSNLMSLLIRKYSEQDKVKLTGGVFSKISSRRVIFDEVDFYCFVEYFKSDSLAKLFRKYEVDTIRFENMDAICKAIHNLLDYYDDILRRSKNYTEIISYQMKLKTCLTLLRFMEIPQEIVDKVCRFILSQEFREIAINDKIMFLDSQLYRKQKYSNFTSKLIEDTLLKYIDRHIQSKKTGTKFEIMSTSSHLNYHCLVQYISPSNSFHSRKLALRIGKILELGDTTLLNHTVNYYVHYVSDTQKRKVIAWAKKTLEESFDFQLFSMLIGFNTRINEAIVENLRIFLREKTSYKEKSNTRIVRVYPVKDCYEELNQAGYWCLLDKIKKESLAEFVGKSDMFDFFYQYGSFDFSKFDISWLLLFNESMLITVSKNMEVCTKIRLIISDALSNQKLSTADARSLSKILAKYFC